MKRDIRLNLTVSFPLRKLLFGVKVSSFPISEHNLATTGKVKN